MAPKYLAILFDIDGTLIITGWGRGRLVADGFRRALRHPH